MNHQPSPFHQTDKGVRVQVRLSPKSSRNAVGGVLVDANGAGALIVRTTVVAENGKANKALIRLLCKSWKRPQSSLRILAGGKSRTKSLLLTPRPGEDASRLLIILTDWLNQQAP